MSSLNNAIASRLRAGQSTNKVSNHKRKSFVFPLLCNTLIKSTLRCSFSVVIISYRETLSEQKERSRTTRCMTIIKSSIGRLTHQYLFYLPTMRATCFNLL